jgi:ribosomal protein L7/L12
MSRRNYHREAIATMERGGLDATRFLWWVAQHFPAVLCKAAKEMDKPKAPVHDAQVLAFIKGGQLLDAIKRCRNITPGMGLKEAKDYCDNLKATLFARE